jgi:hypothetical protein
MLLLLHAEVISELRLVKLLFDKARLSFLGDEDDSVSSELLDDEDDDEEPVESDDWLLEFDCLCFFSTFSCSTSCFGLLLLLLLLLPIGLAFKFELLILLMFEVEVTISFSLEVSVFLVVVFSCVFVVVFE